jgi:hypothetical protein
MLLLIEIDDNVFTSKTEELRHTYDEAQCKESLTDKDVLAHLLSFEVTKEEVHVLESNQISQKLAKLFRKIALDL